VITEVTLTAAVEIDSALSLTVGTTNSAAARMRQLVNAIDALESAIDANRIGEVQEALKRALEAIHELADCRARGEWRPDWDDEGEGLWRAHIGARNAAHHTSSPLAVLRSDAARDERLLWALQSSAITGLRSERQASEYRDRLHEQPVLPSLRQISERLAAAIE
jgi:hypothetical protein